MKARVRRISGGHVSARNKGKIDGLAIVDGTEIAADPTSRLAAELSLEKTIAKLKQEHKQVLARLHQEIDELKRQNQKLQFLITIGGVSKLGRNATASGYRRLQSDKPTKPKAALEENRVHSAKNVRPRGSGRLQRATNTKVNQEILADANQGIASVERTVNELKRILQDEKCRNIELLNKLATENARNMPQESQTNVKQESSNGTLNPKRKRTTSEKSDVRGSCPLPFSATLEPFLVHNLRPPTAEECETIIKTLKEGADKKSHEILSIRTDLKDVIELHKLTPESYLLAKYYAQETSKCDGIMKRTCKQGITSGKQPAVVSFPDRRYLLPPAEKLGFWVRKK